MKMKFQKLYICAWCNGSISDSKSLGQGSNPCVHADGLVMWRLDENKPYSRGESPYFWRGGRVVMYKSAKLRSG